MKFRAIKLQNFRSFVDETIYITDGLNILLGENGSGKSSVLIALGTLFNHTALPLKELIRGGEKSATVTIMFDDYVSVRQFGVASKWELSDTNGNILAEGTKAVQEYLERILNMPPDVAFNNIIAAAQFDLPSMFKATPAIQRALFNDILQVQDFEQAYTGMKGVVRLVKDDMAFAKGKLSKAQQNEEQLQATRLQYKHVSAELKLVEMLLKENALYELEDAFNILQQYDSLLADYHKHMSAYTRDMEHYKRRLAELEAKIRTAENFQSNMSAYKAKLKIYEKQMEALQQWQIEVSAIKAKNKIHADHATYIDEHGKCPVCGQDVDSVEFDKPIPLPPKPEVNVDYNTAAVISTANEHINNLEYFKRELAELVEPTKPNRPDEPPVNAKEINERIEALNQLRESEADLLNSQSRLAGVIEHLEKQETVKEIETALQALETLELKVNSVRNVFKELGPTVTQDVCDYVASLATNTINPVLKGKLEWKEYKLVLKTDRDSRSYNNLSGGQQVIVALAMRLAMADYFGYNTLILDEPTLALDERARNQVDLTLNQHGLEQIIMATHDSIFSGDNILYITNNGQSHARRGNVS